MKFTCIVIALTITASNFSAFGEKPSLGALKLTSPFVLPSFLATKQQTEEGKVDASTEIDTSVPLSQAASIDEVLDAPLMNDIEMLSDILAEVVRKDNPRVYELYKLLRKHGIDRAADPNNVQAFENMKQLAFDLHPVDTLGVMRIFSLALNLVNAAEVQHRLRLMREHELALCKNNKVGPLPMLDDSVRGVIEKVIEEGEGDEEAIFEKLLNQKVEIVLTAHPTEVNRKTLLRKYRSITESLGYLERPDLHPYERSEAMLKISQNVAAIWGSDEVRRQKPTPQQEAAGGNAIIESILWDAVPSYLRKLDAQCRISLGRKLPLDAVPIKFASWIGGDRDGNPNVTPPVTREVVTQQRLRAAKLFLRDVTDLYRELAISQRFSDKLLELNDSLPVREHKKEKYRNIIGHLQSRLIQTIKMCEADLASMGTKTAFPSTLQINAGFVDKQEHQENNIAPITSSNDLLEPLNVIYDSLVETGFELIAEGNLSNIIRRVYTFGLTLVPLDIREESTRHKIAIDAITTHLGIGSYKEWTEEAKLSFLQAELTGNRPLFTPSQLDEMGLDQTVLNTIRTYETASTLGSESLGAYVISQAQTASDVLAVMLLQKQFGMTPQSGKMMRVVPLFETLDDLTNSASVLETLFSMPAYVGAIKGKQEVMVGYSDSAKDAGRLAASYALYTSQMKMSEIAAKHGIELTFFHGKGGTVGRGGNPALFRAILSHPPGTINSRFRVTEQGEMITQNFGTPAIAERTLDIYTAAILREAFVKHVEPTEKWKKQMERISKTSCAGYRHLVREEPKFVPYFRQATPELELGSLNIGSRPAKRNPKGGIESLRAIPWTFAWTQTRLHLSAWLGVGDGLTSENEEDTKEMREMYQNWPWFRETVDLVAMILSKTDFSIAENYDNLLVDKELLELGKEVRNNLVKTREAVLNISGSSDYAGPHVQLLRASTKIRNPYVDSINCVQAELLKELRNMPPDDAPDVPEDVREIKNVRKDALIASVNGIAQGMKNSG